MKEYNKPIAEKVEFIGCNTTETDIWVDEPPTP